MSDPFRVIVAGSRTFHDYDFLRRKLDILLAARKPRVLIVSGGAPGADMLGEHYALAHLPEPHYIRYPADWKRHGRAAGPIRNREMAANADALVAFQVGVSRGTADMILVAKSAGLMVKVYRFPVTGEEDGADE